MKVVVVESPSKAKTIFKYLGKDYKVLASYGHVRDLPSKNGSVDPKNHFHMVWEVADKSQSHIEQIMRALHPGDQLLLATDPDREGEAISWHVQEILKEKNLLKGIDVKRIVFHEITKKAVLQALEKPREINKELVEAYLARRSLDYLVGFTLSPILWRKLPGSRSAGRVQSVALRLVDDREKEIETFKSEEYWTLLGHFLGNPSKKVNARLTHFEGKKLDKFDISNEKKALQAQGILEKQTYSVASVEKKQVKRNPAPPFITSTLQQEASRKLGFGARKTMQIAQRLYEGLTLGSETVGLITYMRTDSVNISQEALQEAQSYIKKTYGDKYALDKPRVFKSKVKNAQEAHEAIRPTSLAHAPETVRTYLDTDQYKLYELIWRRFLASQMEQAIFDQVGVDIQSKDKAHIFRATGSTLVFDGFLKIYEEGRDEGTKEEDLEEDSKKNLLPSLTAGEVLDLEKIEPTQHFTQPPPRYTEASLVKRLEELGIGRPSTYATIMSTLIDRKYVRIDRKQLIPESLGRLVSVFLKNYFPKYVEYDFTASLEEELDHISNGELDWLKVLKEFWAEFESTVGHAEKLRITEVLDTLEHQLEALIFPEKDEEGKPSHQCPQCADGQLHLKLGKFGGFIGCSHYPTCTYTRPFTTAHSEDETAATSDAPAPQAMTEPKQLGKDPQTGLMITLRKGPYGFYFQWGESTEKGQKPKRLSVPKGKDPMTITLDQVLALGQLPRKLGIDPETKEELLVDNGRFGPYIKRGSQFYSVGKKADILTITLEEALDIIKNAPEKKSKPKNSKKK